MKNATDLSILIDRSGSMASIRADMEGALSSFLKEQREVPGELRVTVYLFDSTQGMYRNFNNNYLIPNRDDDWFIEQYKEVLVENIKEISIVPRGGTALYDAMMEGMRRTGERLAKKNEQDRPDKVLFITITDGGENASTTHSKTVADAVRHQETKYNWKFVYLGANQDSFLTGDTLGMTNSRGNCVNYMASAGGTKTAGVMLSNATKRYRSAEVQMKAADNFFSEDEQKNCENAT